MNRCRWLIAAAIAGMGGAAGLTTQEAAAQIEEGSGRRCYMAFIHGSGDKFHDEEPTSQAIAAYWTSDGSDGNSFVFYAARLWAGDQGCVSLRVGYDGNQQWWHERAAGKVAATLNDFIKRHSIPDGGLVLVGHSMGGVVSRYIVNNGMPNSPFYNEYLWLDSRMDYDLVRRKTGYLISVQSPHAGTQAADALYGDADRAFTSVGAAVVNLFDLHDKTPASSVLTRSYMEAAGAPGGEMADEGRTVPIYTIAGTQTGDGAGTGMDADSDLDLSWILLCYKKGARNSWGAACRWDFWNFKATPGDGLVEQQSAHGRWLRGSPNGQSTIFGSLRPWLDVIHNHNHGRFDALNAGIVDRLKGVRTSFWLGSYIGDHRPR